jgi:5-methylcytosine-specific restriction endonuclease McrA
MNKEKMATSDYYALMSTCNKCGFTGQDWAFKYQGLCSKCYKKWRKQKAAERRALEPKNDNIRIKDNLVVTGNVRDRLLRKSHADTPFSRMYHIAETLTYISFFALIIPLLLYLFSVKMPSYLLIIFFVLPLVVISAIDYMENVELNKRMQLVNERLEKLAYDRQKQIEETKRFYNSPEWRLLRKKIIKSHKNVCKSCDQRIHNKNDITVDHILPRSKFPDNLLEIDNLQILCRSCNSSKGNRIIEKQG